MSNYIEYNDTVAFHPGYYIKEIVDESGLTQKDFAKKLGTTPKNLSLLIRGEQSLSIDIAMKLSIMLGKEMDDNKYYHEAQRLSNEILSDKSLPNQIYSQSLIKVMQEKIDFFKSNSGKNSIDYNAVSGQLTILNGKQQTLCQLNNPNFNLFKEFGVNREDAQRIQAFLRQTSVHNKEIFVQIKAKVDNDSQMY